MVFGVEMPLIVNSVPLMVIREMVWSAAPRLVSTRLLLPFSPTETVPKSMAAGFTDNCGWELTAVAERLATTGALPESPWAVNVPVRIPADLGLTATVKLPDWPAANVIGVVIPVTLN